MAGHANAPGALMPYAGKAIALATMHRKERAIEPVVRKSLGGTLTVARGIDTDALGTFTGEVERPGNMTDVAIAKARLGMAETGLPIGLASEGSIGPHSANPFAQAGLELMVLIDDDRDIVVSESLVDDEPCFSHITAGPDDDARVANFLAEVGFPVQGVIVRPDGRTVRPPVFKGLQNGAALRNALRASAGHSETGLVILECDLRAHMNPRRMVTLGRLAERLAVRLNTLCPACSTPGFGFAKAEPGLPCAWCGDLTSLARHGVNACVYCTYEERHPRSDGLDKADPRYCPGCNP